MKEIVDYKFIWASAPQTLGEWVSAAVAEGWQPFGSPGSGHYMVMSGSVAVSKHGVYQAVVKYDDSRSPRKVLGTL